MTMKFTIDYLVDWMYINLMLASKWDTKPLYIFNC